MVLGMHRSDDLPEYGSLLQRPQQWGPAVLAAAQLAAAVMDNWTAQGAAAAAAVEHGQSTVTGPHSSSSSSSSSSSKGKPEAKNHSDRVQRGTAAAELGMGERVLRDITGPVVIAVESIALTLGQAFDQDEGASSWLRVVDGASPDTLRGMWRVLFVYLGWAVQAEHEKLHSRPASGGTRASLSSSSSSNSSSSMSSNNSSSNNAGAAQQGGQQTQPAGCYHEQFLACMGAPAAADGHITPIPSFAMLNGLSFIAQRSVLGSSRSGSSSSGTTAEEANVGWEQQQSLLQLGRVLRCPEAPLLLLQLLQNSFRSLPMAAATMAAASVGFEMPPSQHIFTWQSSLPLLHGMLMGLREAKGAAVAGAAAASLLGPVLQLPNALLHSAAAAGCKGLKEPDEDGQLEVLRYCYPKLLCTVGKHAAGELQARACAQLPQHVAQVAPARQSWRDRYSRSVEFGSTEWSMYCNVLLLQGRRSPSSSCGAHINLTFWHAGWSWLFNNQGLSMWYPVITCCVHAAFVVLQIPAVAGHS
jgi:hypothetical protein